MKKILLAIFAAVAVLPVSAKNDDVPASITVLSYNIRLGPGNDGTNSWEFRYPASALMVMDQKPDVMGLQEAYDYQKKYLEDVCKGYKAIGVGRDNGKKKGEIMAIFYNTKTVSLKKWGTFWLSETPDQPGKGWDAACNRTATWGIFKHKKSGKYFFYVNTHLDHKGWTARKEGLALIMKKAQELNPNNYPVILTGDFNIRPEREEMDDLKKVMKDARETAFSTDHLGTFNGWGKAQEGNIIDYIWYKGFSSCPKYETIRKEYYERTYISDHYPIKAQLIF